MEKISFSIEGLNIQYANIIRIYIINSIKCSVIENVIIKNNTSYFCDEMIAQRLGLIPLIKVNENEESEESVDKTNCKISLSAIGPKNIYSKDIIFSNDSYKMVSDEIFLLSLGDKEVIDIIGDIEEGTYYTKEHAKFSVSCGTSYKKISDDLFVLYVETTGSISAKDALIESIDNIIDDYEKLKKDFRSLNSKF